MTESEALFKTVLLWSYIAKHSNISKVEAYNALNLEPDLALCPLCTYAAQGTKATRGIDCRKCLLMDLWPSGCYNPGSPYLEWSVRRGTKLADIAAQTIADAAQGALREVRGAQRIASAAKTEFRG